MEIQKKAAQTWDALPEEKKKVYNDMFANENVKYKQDLAAWELKMIRVGNLDLVRSDALIDDPKSSRKPKVHRGPRKQSSDSDWNVGWCSSPDDKQQHISTIKDSLHTSSPNQPAADKHLRQEIEIKVEKIPKVSSEVEADTTGDNNNSTTKSQELPIEITTIHKPDEKSKGSVINKLKTFFKF